MNLKFWTWGKEEKASRTGVLVGSGFPGGTVWAERNYENFAKEVYMKNVIAFTCISYIAMSISSVPFGIFRTLPDGEREQDAENPFNELLRMANPQTTWTDLVIAAISYLCMAGNAFIEKVSPLTGENAGIAKELWVLRPDRMKINVDDKTGQIVGYTYSIGGQKVPFKVDPITMQSDILHMKMFHPLNDFWGMATTEPAGRKIDTANSMDTWNKNLMDNYGRPGLLFMFEHELGDDQYKRLKEELEKKVSGGMNAGKNLILEGAKDAKPYGWTPAEIDWIKSNLELARGICIAWHVPPQLIGIPDAATYANYQEARTAFWEETGMFYLNFFRNKIDAWLFPENDLQFDYILDDVPAFQYKRDLKWKRAQDSTFITINEKRKMVGMDPIEGGDVILVSATMIPLGTEEQTEEDMTNEEDQTRNALIKQGYTEKEIEELMK